MEDLFQEAPPLSDEDQRLADLYEEIGRPLDDLPYTDDFDRLYQALKEKGDTREPVDVFRRLMALRKRARLPRLGRSPTVGLPMSLDEEEILADLIPKVCGTIGQRDRLPYTPHFNDLVAEFNRQTSRHLTPHDVWKLVTRIAK